MTSRRLKDSPSNREITSILGVFSRRHSNGQTASAQVGWIVVGVGVGGSVAVEGNILPEVAGGTAGIIVGNGSGQDKIE
jgi:hypothetical protein